MVDSRYENYERLTQREQLIIVEIGADKIDSASSFVIYMSEAYGISKSSVWYALNRLKERRLVDFASKDDPGRQLALTEQGNAVLHKLAGMRNRLLESYATAYLNGNGIVTDRVYKEFSSVPGH
ncbi:hypothetical protein M1373_00565 [Candidatus Marsarchaeota archaeon]|nr:hypothetical protein [Candidatus Marsarchaeota archaeon]MCL5404736.1 hypothetical protein [Candidatus Marsarchaeota archaeon]